MNLLRTYTQRADSGALRHPCLTCLTFLTSHPTHAICYTSPTSGCLVTSGPDGQYVFPVYHATMGPVHSVRHMFRSVLLRLAFVRNHRLGTWFSYRLNQLRAISKVPVSSVVGYSAYRSHSLSRTRWLHCRSTRSGNLLKLPASMSRRLRSLFRAHACRVAVLASGLANSVTFIIVHLEVFNDIEDATLPPNFPCLPCSSRPCDALLPLQLWSRWRRGTRLGPSFVASEVIRRTCRLAQLVPSTATSLRTALLLLWNRCPRAMKRVRPLAPKLGPLIATSRTSTGPLKGPTLASGLWSNLFASSTGTIR